MWIALTIFQLVVSWHITDLLLTWYHSIIDFRFVSHITLGDVIKQYYNNLSTVLEILKNVYPCDHIYFFMYFYSLSMLWSNKYLLFSKFLFNLQIKFILKYFVQNTWVCILKNIFMQPKTMHWWMKSTHI